MVAIYNLHLQMSILFLPRMYMKKQIFLLKASHMYGERGHIDCTKLVTFRVEYSSAWFLGPVFTITP